MSRLLRRRVLVFIGLVGLSILILVAYSLLRAPSGPCESSAGFTDGHVYLVDSMASARAWLDSNGDGIRQPAEPWLEDVCIWNHTELERFDEEMVSSLCADSDIGENLSTDENGKWSGNLWAGACCSDIYIFAIPPEGYQATTPLVANGCLAEFGFVPAESAPTTEQFSTTDYVLQLQTQQREEQVLDTVKIIAIVLGVLAAALIGSFIIVRPSVA